MVFSNMEILLLDHNSSENVLYAYGLVISRDWDKRLDFNGEYILFCRHRDRDVPTAVSGLFVNQFSSACTVDSLQVRTV